MGKHGKKQRGSSSKHSSHNHTEYYDPLPSSSYDLPHNQEEEPEPDEHQEEEEHHHPYILENTSPMDKYSLYQRSVQSPKGDISYMLKFFLTYVGGRLPLHLREDFCGTAFLSAEWLRNDPRRTALGLDLDSEALLWGLENNIVNLGSDAYSRVNLFHGNVLNSVDEAKLVRSNVLDSDNCKMVRETANDVRQLVISDCSYLNTTENIEQIENHSETEENCWQAADIVCAFNYSCCCLQKRSELLSYFQQAYKALSTKGGIFIMDLYGGTSSECALKIRRKCDNFTLIWEQENFDIITRRTKISLHFLNKKTHKKENQAFTYSWRLWTLPEIKDCLEEAGFSSVHFWIRDMPDVEDREKLDKAELEGYSKYEEVASFNQQDSWNAYIVGVRKDIKKQNRSR